MQTFLFQCLLAASVEVGITNTVSQTKHTLFCEKHKDGEWRVCLWHLSCWSRLRAHSHFVPE